MNETKTDRRTWLKRGGSAVAGAFGACVVGPAAAQGPGPAARAEGVNFRWTLEIQGGYGWLFKKDRTVLVMALESSSCDFFEHKMTLVVSKLDADLDGGTYAPKVEGDYNTWVLNGATTFTEGLPKEGVTPGKKSDWDKLEKPYGPKPAHEDDPWDDRVWLTEPVAAKTDAHTLAKRSILVPDGVLSVRKPRNDWGVYCRWKFTDSSGKKKRKALTDRLMFQKDLSGTRIGLKTDGGTIVLKPKGLFLPTAIRHEFKLTPMTFEKNQPLPHFAMLYDFSKNIKCKDATVPKLEKRDDFDIPESENASPGDLCPPLMLFEE